MNVLERKKNLFFDCQIGLIRRAIWAQHVRTDIGLPIERGHLDSMVSTFNSLSLPKSYIYVDSDMLVHYVQIDISINEAQIPRFVGTTTVHDAADVIWKFDAFNGVWTTFKDQTGPDGTGRFSKVSPVSHGGIKR